MVELRCCSESTLREEPSRWNTLDDSGLGSLGNFLHQEIFFREKSEHFVRQWVPIAWRMSERETQRDRERGGMQTWCLPTVSANVSALGCCHPHCNSRAYSSDRSINSLRPNQQAGWSSSSAIMECTLERHAVAGKTQTFTLENPTALDSMLLLLLLLLCVKPCCCCCCYGFHWHQRQSRHIWNFCCTRRRKTQSSKSSINPDPNLPF